MICQIGKQSKPYGSCSSILRVLGLILDCKRFLETQATYWNPFLALNCPATMKSVSKFLLKFCNLVMDSQQLFRVLCTRVHLCLCM